jgi:hypothetical protein
MKKIFSPTERMEEMLRATGHRLGDRAFICETIHSGKCIHCNKLILVRQGAIDGVFCFQQIFIGDEFIDTTPLGRINDYSSNRRLVCSKLRTFV